MVITSSRATSTKCWRKTFNVYHRDLEGPRSMNLTDGGAVHAGIAYGLATKDWVGAKKELEERFAEDVAVSDIPQEQAYLIEDHRDLCVALMDAFAEHVADAPYEVVQPECAINVALPNTEHYCIWIHWWDEEDREFKWGRPPADKILRGAVKPAHSPSNDSMYAHGGNCPCYQPHRVLGQTDALVLWENNLWLLEHKTTAMIGDQFWAGFELDLQPSIYLYGIWKQLEVQPRGVVVNALYKPSEKMVSSWNDKRKNGPAKAVKDYIKVERQPILRSLEDLLRIEKVLTELCTEWEWRIVNGFFRPALMKTVCIEYARRCDFHTACSCHEEEGCFDALAPRHKRYDDEYIESLVQIATR